MSNAQHQTTNDIVQVIKTEEKPKKSRHWIYLMQNHKSLWTWKQEIKATSA